ncbi:hypothetical protein GY45DRAFT_421051 [Cubamyces sp. BRFM 1775]|nr:hypothetical protein GY45DRAFT_421051 [Cubamyces sp. BRFM 1775]
MFPTTCAAEPSSLFGPRLTTPKPPNILRRVPVERAESSPSQKPTAPTRAADGQRIPPCSDASCQPRTLHALPQWPILVADSNRSRTRSYTRIPLPTPSKPARDSARSLPGRRARTALPGRQNREHAHATAVIVCNPPEA